MANTPSELLPTTCYSDASRTYAMPSNVADVPVVISTLVTASRLLDKRLRRGHFQYVLIDEAAQAKEAETAIPLVLLDPAGGGRLILGGDPCQLGPVVMSDAARAGGLGVSLMERLMRDCPRYHPGTAATGASCTRLVDNYRSHGALLTVPSALFYGGSLVECAPRATTGALARLPLLGGRDFPLLFHAVEGRHQREGTDPSWFNADEAATVLSHVRALLDAAVPASEIVVLSPYRGQVGKVRRLLASAGCPVRTASVEEFQGGEATAVLITTVRSADRDGADPAAPAAVEVGFLASAKRFNVAVTRAMAALIVVGSPHLAADPHWAALIAHAVAGGGYRGVPLPPAYDAVVAAAAARLRGGVGADVAGALGGAGAVAAAAAGAGGRAGAAASAAAAAVASSLGGGGVDTGGVGDAAPVLFAWPADRPATGAGRARRGRRTGGRGARGRRASAAASAVAAAAASSAAAAALTATAVPELAAALARLSVAADAQ